MPTTYPTELKVKTIRRYENGESIKALSQELHISQSTLYQWRKEYCSIELPNRTYTPAEFDAMARRLKKLEHYVEIIHQSGHLSSVPLQKKLTTLEELYNRPGNPYSVHELCDALEVARGTFYNHIFRKADRSKYQEEQAQLMLKVKQVFDDSDQRFGAEKIRIVLAESGIRVGKKRISAIMQELGLYSVRVDAKKQFKRKQQYEKQNLLKRKFSAEHPNQIWVSDITYFKVKSYWVYLCIILDLYSRKIIGWRVSKHMSTHLVTATFKTTFQERGRPQNLTFHSDRGSQYISKTLTGLFQQYGVKQSFSATARPLDNAVAETFFSSFKREEAYRKDYTSEQHFRRSAEEYIQFYNEVRPHQTLNYKTPQAFEDAYNSVFSESGV
ncbi:MAG: IS3 family transposase [Oscillospiraceae bacterium]